MKYFNLVLFFALLVAFNACKSKSKIVDNELPKPQEGLQLLKTSWLALSSTNTVGEVYNFSKSYEITFDTARAMLRLDVNTCNNQYTWANNTLSFASPFGCTKKCCDSKDGTELMKSLQGDWKVSLDANKNLLLESETKGKILWKPIVR